MGLDLYLVRATSYDKKGRPIFNDEPELCYGRKTWNIAEFFMEESEMVKDDWLWRVPIDVWNEFVEIVWESEIFQDGRLESILDRWHYDGEEPNVTFEEIELVEKFVHNFYWDTPTLGYDWEAHAILEWAAQDERVQEAYRNNPNDIYLIVSY